jgi:hypothetical protein
MLVEFLSDEQVAAYGCFVGEPPRSEVQSRALTSTSAVAAACALHWVLPVAVAAWK